MTRRWPKGWWSGSGAEIDQRIAAGIGERVTAEVDNRIVAQLDRYAGCRHQRRSARRMMRVQRADRAERSSVVLALGSVLFALLITAIVLKGSPGGASVVLMALVWVIVGVINVAHAIRRDPPR